MSDNPAFVLKGVEDVVYEQRPVPEREWIICYVNGAHSSLTSIAVRDDEVLVAIKKTGKVPQSQFPYESLTESRHLWFGCMSLRLPSVHQALDFRRIRFIISCMEGLLTSWWRNRW